MTGPCPCALGLFGTVVFYGTHGLEIFGSLTRWFPQIILSSSGLGIANAYERLARGEGRGKVE